MTPDPLTDEQLYATGYDFSSVERIAFFFGPQNKKLFGTFHFVDGATTTDSAILLCPSLGVEYMDPYRPLRYIADYHAMAGIPALRFDYHGTGDSSGLNNEPNRLEDWMNSIKLACQQLREMSGCKKIILFGFRFGGTLATLVSQELSIDGLILWAPLESGRRYIREIRALQMTAVNQPEDTGLLEAGGAVFVPETAEEIGKIKLDMCIPKANHILLIPRDDLPANDKLKQSWEQQGLSVNQKLYQGFAEMVLEARFVRIPHTAIQKIVEWTCKISEHGTISETFNLSGLASTMSLPHFNDCTDDPSDDAGMIQESIVYYGPDRCRIGILSSPENPGKTNQPIVILANSGSNHRVGPNRLYVLLARTLARNGYRCLRIDMDGLGDSAKPDPETENIVYMNHSSDEIHLAIKSFGKNYRDNKYILMGLCSGAYFAFRASIDLLDVDIVECYMINPLTFHWEEGMTNVDSQAVTYLNWYSYKKSIRNPASWIKLFTGRVSVKNIFATVWNRLVITIFSKIESFPPYKYTTSGQQERKNLDQNLHRLADRNIHMSFLLSRDDAGYDILMSLAGKTAGKLQKKSQLTIQFIENADHTFSRYIPRCQAINKVVEHIVTHSNKWLVCLLLGVYFG